MLSQAVSKTLLLPLKARAQASLDYPELHFKDNQSEKVWVTLQEFIQEDSEATPVFIANLVARTKVFDRMVLDVLSKNAETLVINLGAGLCTRNNRINDRHQNYKWVNIDFDSVISAREEYLESLSHEQNIAFDLGNKEIEGLLKELIVSFKGQQVVVIAEGVVPYLTKEEIKEILVTLRACALGSSKQLYWAFDYCHPNYGFKEALGNNTYFSEISFKDGFKSLEDIFKLLGESLSYRLYQLPFSAKCNQSYGQFLVNHNGESPYEIILVNMKSENVIQKFLYMGEELEWNPSYNISFLSNGQVFFLSQEDFHLSSLEEVMMIKQYLEDSQSLYGTMNEIQAIYWVDVFLDLGLLKKSEDKSSFYISKVDFTSNEHELGGQSYLVSHWNENESIKKIIEEFKEQDVNFIFTHDFHHSSVRNQILYWLELDKKVMVVCLDSSKVLLSPLLTKRENFDLFYGSLKLNIPHLQWVKKYSSNEIYAPSKKQIEIPFLNSVISHIYSKLSLDTSFMTLIEIMSSNGAVNEHVIADYEQVEITKSLPSDQEKIVEWNSGFRTKKSYDILSEIVPLISDMTGFVSHPELISNLQHQSFTYSCTFPSRIHTQQLEGRKFFNSSLGKGFDSNQSKISAIAEGVERFSMNFNGREDFKKMEYENQSNFIDPKSLFMFSDQQYASSNYQPFSSEQSIYWAQGYSLTKQCNQYLPAVLCYQNFPFDRETLRFSSNGCASGTTVKEAILQGILELVERDAVALWWYQKQNRKGVCLDLFKDQVNAFDQQDWKVWVLDVTNDLNIPVMIAVSQSVSTNEFRLGFGAHLEASIAVKRALSELHQIIEVCEVSKPDFNFADIKAEDYLFPTEEVELSEGNQIETIDEGLAIIQERIESQGFEIIYKNLSRSNVPIKTVNVFIPNLCFIWPEFGNARLYQTDGNREAFKEEELNELALFV